jgi:elongation factor P
VPTFVTLEVVAADAAVRGDTATNVLKKVTLETGAEVQAPAFIKEGDVLKIDTRTGEYVERYNK